MLKSLLRIRSRDVKKNLLILFILLSLNIFADSIRVIVPDGLPALSIVNMVSTTKEIDGKR